MEKVQFQLEATLPELKDLYEKGLFAKNEIDQITKRRTAYETSLIRQKTRKEDFFKYAEYEINLERLRKVRWRRLKYHLNPPPPSASTYSLPRRASYILKRATVKFPGDLAVWLAYVEYASREGMRKVVLKGLNSALHHHPLSPTLYLLLSYHHLHPNAPFPGSAIPSTSKLDLPSAGDHDDDDDDTNVAGFSLEGTASARTNILLGLRMIPKSHDLWREYIKLELGWVEGLRRRWQVLGVNIEPKTNAGAGGEVDPEALTGGEGSFGPDGEDARKSILSGNLVIHALNSALTAIPATEPRGMEFRQDLLDTLRIYPSALRSKCLDVVYDDLRQISSSSSSSSSLDAETETESGISKAIKATAQFAVLTKELYDRKYEPERKDEGGVVLEGADLVDVLGKIGKEIRTVAKSGQYGEKWLLLSGEWLVQQISQCGENADLRQYLFSILTTLTKAQYKPPASLLCWHLEALRASPADANATTVLETARAHCAQYPSNPVLQLARLELERTQNTDVESVRKCFKSAMKSIAVPDLSTHEQIAGLRIWETYLDFEEQTQTPQTQAVGPGDNNTRVDGIYRKVLRDTLRQTAISDLHQYILVKYLDFLIRHQPKTILSSLERISQTYRPNHAFFLEAFDIISERSLTRLEDLRVAYRLWRAASLTSNEDKVEATLHWAEWLLDNKHGKEAGDAVDVMRREVGQDGNALAALERGWAFMLDNAERHPGSIDESDESEGEGEGEDVEMS